MREEGECLLGSWSGWLKSAEAYQEPTLCFVLGFVGNTKMKKIWYPCPSGACRLSKRFDRVSDQALWAGELEGGENIYPDVSWQVSCFTRLKNWKNTNPTGYVHDSVWWMILFHLSGQVSLNFRVQILQQMQQSVCLHYVVSRFLHPFSFIISCWTPHI